MSQFREPWVAASMWRRALVFNLGMLTAALSVSPVLIAEARHTVPSPGQAAPPRAIVCEGRGAACAPRPAP